MFILRTYKIKTWTFVARIVTAAEGNGGTSCIFQPIRSSIRRGCEACIADRANNFETIFGDDCCRFSSCYSSVLCCTKNNKHISSPYLCPSFLMLYVFSTAPKTLCRPCIAVLFYVIYLYSISSEILITTMQKNPYNNQN